ncbi:MAG: site-specific DNA-methyltransferase [Fuerstiella sp.]
MVRIHAREPHFQTNALDSMEPTFERKGHRLFHGESIAVLTDLVDRGERFDALLTDPPYASGGLHLGDKSQSTRDKYIQTSTIRTHHDFAGDARSQTGWLHWCALWLNLCRRMLVEGAPVLLFTDWRQIGAAITALEAGGFIHRGIVVWDKKNCRPTPNGFRAQSEFIVVGSKGKRPPRSPNSVYQPGVFQHSTPPMKVRRHQTQKPVGLLKDLLAIVPAGGRVLDPFAGSGSLIEAADECGLKATGIEEQKPIADDASEWLRNVIGTQGKQIA